MVERRRSRSRRRLRVLRNAALLFALVTAGTTQAEEAAVRAREILDRVDDLFRGSSSTGRATMRVTTEHWTRSLTLEFTTEGKEKSLIRVLAPKKERGTATLKVGNDLWNYLPKVKRVVKLPSSMMSASWMGSHLTNDDLVKESRMAEDYDFTITFEGERDGREVIEITCIPKEDAVVEWGKVVVVVEASSRLPLRLDYHDEDLALVRTMTYEDVRELGGRRLPARFTVVPSEEPEESTVVGWETMEFDAHLGSDVFTLRSLQK